MGARDLTEGSWILDKVCGSCVWKNEGLQHGGTFQDLKHGVPASMTHNSRPSYFCSLLAFLSLLGERSDSHLTVKSIPHTTEAQGQGWSTGAQSVFSYFGGR